MMEYWYNGIMVSGIMQFWAIGPAIDGIDNKIKIAQILMKTNIPTFHHSIIPFSEQIRKPKKPLYYLWVAEIPIHLGHLFLLKIIPAGMQTAGTHSDEFSH